MTGVDNVFGPPDAACIRRPAGSARVPGQSLAASRCKRLRQGGVVVMMETWVLVADQARARVFGVLNGRGQLVELGNLVHPQGRLHDGDLDADRPGRSFDSEGAGRHAMSRRHAATDQEGIRFARTVSDWLSLRHARGDFRRLVISAPPRFLGLLRDALPERVIGCVVLSLDKEMATLDTEEIRAHLPERL